MMNKRLLLLILCFVITSCTMDCVEPGLQGRNTSVNVDVPVKEGNDGAKIHWVDSNQVISKDEQIKFNISGSINFCPSKDGINPREILVPAGFCADGSKPNYEKAKDINNVPDNYGINEDELCGAQGFGSNRRYVDTKIKVNPGDKLSFSLVPRKMKIDCDKLDNFILDDNCYKNEDINDKNKVTASELCKGGTFFCENKEKKREEKKFDKLDKPLIVNKKEQTRNDEVLVGNGYTPYDNKIHFNVGGIDVKKDVPWMIGVLSDLRRTKTGLNELCDEERSKGGDWKKRCGLEEMKKYSSYELNCYDQNICYNAEGIWNFSISGKKNCVSSIRYKKYDVNNKCDMYSHLKEFEDKLKKAEEDKKNGKPVNIDFTSGTESVSWAEALVAKIADPYSGDPNIFESDRGDMKGTAEGTQCLPNDNGVEGDSICSKINDNFEDFSLKLDHDYKVNNDVKPGSSVMLAVADHGAYHLDRGGYHVRISRSCEFDSGKKLYVYLGDSPPKDLSTVGSNDFKAVAVKGNDGNYHTIDVIDGSHLNEEESKKIHFGIDVSNVKKDEIMDKDGKYYENNQYNVNLFVKRKINDFISSNVNKIFKFLKDEVVTDDRTKSTYGKYKKGLLQGVRALLTLYVIFSTVGYMLGTIQLSKFDFIVRITKIAFIAFVFSDKSWELFGTNLSKLFVDGSTYLIDSFSGYIGEGGRRFAFLDLTAGVLFSGETWLKFLSLMLSGPFGFIAFLLILKATFMFLKCIISATVKYVIATVLVAFLLSLTPLFIVFILFQQTKPLFDNWIKTLAHVSLQPVILFSSLSLLNQLMYSVLYNLTNFSACYQCLISVNFLNYDLCLMKSILPLGYSPGTSVDTALSSGERAGGYFAALPIDLIQAFIYLMIASAMEAFVSASESMAQAIFSSGHGVAGSVGTVARSASQALLSTVGFDDQTQGMIRRIRGEKYKDPAELAFKNKSPSNNQTPGQSGSQKSSSNQGSLGSQGNSSETTSISSAKSKKED